MLGHGCCESELVAFSSICTKIVPSFISIEKRIGGQRYKLSTNEKCNDANVGMPRQSEKYHGTKDDGTILREKIISKVVANECLTISPLIYCRKNNMGTCPDEYITVPQRSGREREIPTSVHLSQANLKFQHGLKAAPLPYPSPSSWNAFPRNKFSPRVEEQTDR